MSKTWIARLITGITLIAPVALLITGGGLIPPGVSWT
ncbi:hypothetical protein HD595_004738 [Nonomuraea roseoviolacea subsp. carminata]|uniref:Uncharacterized protein n=1 Tax=Nonomuraea roseoviolacea subsp. carminata TaxID=160689 RepID=A0ABT1K3P6_9ACTN|nr:hypothetical protein [Nonomuraea roseoviolacea subsp. carminata]